MAPADEGTYQLQAEFTEWGVTYQSSELPFKVRAMHLNDYSWSQIQQIIASGQAPVTFAECFENGCCKEIPLSAGTTTIPFDSYSTDNTISAQNIYVNILGFDHDEPADVNAFRHTVTFGMAQAEKIADEDGDIIKFIANQSKDITSDVDWIGYGRMKEDVLMAKTSYNDKGDIVMTDFLNTVYSQCLSAELRDMIVPVAKKTSAGNRSPEIVTTIPHLFLFSEVELTGQWYRNADGSITEEGNNGGHSSTQYGYLGSYEGEGSQYEYYSCVNDKADLRPLKYRLCRSCEWWTRSPKADYFNSFCGVNVYGNACGPSYDSNCVSFGFCIR